MPNICAHIANICLFGSRSVRALINWSTVWVDGCPVYIRGWDLPVTPLAGGRGRGGGAGNRLPGICCPGTWRCRWNALLRSPCEYI